jgi:hypothetical protein
MKTPEDEWRRNNWRCGHGWLRGEQCEICNAAQPVQPVQEPVAWMTPDGEGFRIRFSPPTNEVPLGWDALYAAPPKRPWIGLTDEERLAALVAIDPLTARLPRGLKLFAEAIEQLLKEHNND